jgi:hypothetical protein
VREFVVELHSGKRLTIRADRCVPQYEGTINFLVDVAPSDEIGRLSTGPDTGAVLDRRQVVWIADKEHLLSEERWTPARGPDEPPHDEEGQGDSPGP